MHLEVQLLFYGPPLIKKTKKFENGKLNQDNNKTSDPIDMPLKRLSDGDIIALFDDNKVVEREAWLLDSFLCVSSRKQDGLTSRGRKFWVAKPTYIEDELNLLIYGGTEVCVRRFDGSTLRSNAIQDERLDYQYENMAPSDYKHIPWLSSLSEVDPEIFRKKHKRLISNNNEDLDQIYLDLTNPKDSGGSIYASRTLI